MPSLATVAIKGKRYDRAGEVYGHWKVISRAEGYVSGTTRWNCQCTACGFERVIARPTLVEKPPRCTNCYVTSPISPTSETALSRKPVPLSRAVNVDELPVAALTIRCSSCQSFGGFLGRRCVNCGLETPEYLPHVDGRRCG